MTDLDASEFADNSVFAKKTTSNISTATLN